MRKNVSKNERERIELKNKGFTDPDINMLFALRDNLWSSAIQLAASAENSTVAIALTDLLLPKLIEFLQQLRKMQSLPASIKKSETAADVKTLSSIVLAFCCLKKNNPSASVVFSVITQLNELNAKGLSERILDRTNDINLLTLFKSTHPKVEQRLKLLESQNKTPSRTSSAKLLK